MIYGRCSIRRIIFEPWQSTRLLPKLAAILGSSDTLPHLLGRRGSLHGGNLGWLPREVPGCRAPCLDGRVPDSGRRVSQRCHRHSQPPACHRRPVSAVGSSLPPYGRPARGWTSMVRSVLADVDTAHLRPYYGLMRNNSHRPGFTLAIDVDCTVFGRIPAHRKGCGFSLRER